MWVPSQKSIDYENGWRASRREFREAEKMAEAVNPMTDVVENTVDAKGRVLPELMSDRELLIETLRYMRTMMDLFEGLGQHPMARSLGMAFPSNPGNR